MTPSPPRVTTKSVKYRKLQHIGVKGLKGTVPAELRCWPLILAASVDSGASRACIAAQQAASGTYSSCWSSENVSRCSRPGRFTCTCSASAWRVASTVSFTGLDRTWPSEARKQSYS